VLAATLHFSASIARERGDYARARALHDESFSLWRELGDEHGVARSSNYVAFLRWLEGDLDAAEAPAEDAYARFTALDDREGLAWALLNGAAIAYYRRQLALARQQAREALSLASEAGYQEGIAWALNLLGNVALREHRIAQARALLSRSLELHRDLGDRWRMCSVLESLAAVFRADGDPTRAARLDAGARALRESLGTPQPPAERDDFAAERLAAAVELGEQRMAALEREGASMRAEQLVAEAL